MADEQSQYLWVQSHILPRMPIPTAESRGASALSRAALLPGGPQARGNPSRASSTGSGCLTGARLDGKRMAPECWTGQGTSRKAGRKKKGCCGQTYSRALSPKSPSAALIAPSRAPGTADRGPPSTAPRRKVEPQPPCSCPVPQPRPGRASGVRRQAAPAPAYVCAAGEMRPRLVLSAPKCICMHLLGQRRSEGKPESSAAPPQGQLLSMNPAGPGLRRAARKPEGGPHAARGGGRGVGRPGVRRGLGGGGAPRLPAESGGGAALQPPAPAPAVLPACRGVKFQRWLLGDYISKRGPRGGLDTGRAW